MRSALVVCGALLAACPKGGEKPKPVDPPVPRSDGGGHVTLLPGIDDAGVLTLPAPPPVPGVPGGLPPLQQPAVVTPAAIALGELLFFDKRLSASGNLACATCHDPAHGYAGAGRQDTAAGKPNLRNAPALVNLAWQKAFGWDGRYTGLAEQLAVHWKGQLGIEPRDAITRVAGLPMYALYFTAFQTANPDGTPLDAVRAYVLTRYEGDAPWDRLERAPDVPADLRAGYLVFSGKAQCSVCHTPPLYTDLMYHRLGLVALGDEGRGRVDPGHQGAFKTPTLRGAAARNGFFHDGSAKTLDEAIDWHLAGGVGQGADPSIVDVKKIVLSPAERAALGVFVRALTSETPPVQPAALP